VSADARRAVLTVSVVSHGQGGLAQRVLDDLSAMDARLARVIVTRNVPEPWTPRLAHPFAELAVTDNARPRGFGANHNAALAACDTEYFAVLNPDLAFRGANLPDVLAAFDDAAVGLASPTILEPDGRVADFARDLMTLPNLLRRQAGAPPRPGPPAWVAGMCLVFRTRALRDVGGFDERYFLYCEDADVCDRLVLAGWKLAVDPALRVVHDAQRLSLRSPRRFAHHVASLLKYWAAPSFWRRRARLAGARREEPAR